ncbi:hypothetical protein, partial [Pleomorphovibrio marinus]|uniref:hypothetical protein n=1 Tax=Pleomorphovibrio marinus TaxID=2164132 RepID=UPI001E2CE4F2
VSNRDDNSLSVDPLYDPGLYAGSIGLIGAGVSVAEVDVDIDGSPRPDPPTIGANEIDPASLSPLEGAYTVNPAGSGDRNFPTLQAAMDALSMMGVSGSVTLRVASGTHEGQAVVPDIPGASATNLVR